MYGTRYLDDMHTIWIYICGYVEKSSEKLVNFFLKDNCQK